MKKLSSCIITCLGFISLATSNQFAYAQSRPGALSFTVGGGYAFLASKRNMDNPGLGLIALGYDITHHWGVEAFLAGFRTHFKKNVEEEKRINGTLFAFDGVYHFCPFGVEPYTLQPYLLAGFGVTGLSHNGSDAHNEGNANAGVGIAFSLHRAVALRFEARDFYTIVGGKNDVILDAGISFIVDMC